jgi:plasmid stabilization system protein ParE
MAQRKIVWSHTAEIKLFQILDFYVERNGSAAYSKKIYKKIRKELTLLLTHPEIGFRTDIDSVRGLIVDNFVLYYEQAADLLIVHTLWDCRQNPDDLIVK